MALAKKNSPFWVVAAIVLLVAASAAAAARTRTVKGTARVPWPVRCQRLFSLPRGRADYLVPYRGLAQYLFGARGIWVRPRKIGAVLARVLRNRKAAAEMREVVQDVTARGVSATALRDRILGALTLSGDYRMPKGRHWAYFSANQRSLLAALFGQRAVELAKGPGRARALRYAKTFEFLLAQESEISPLAWVDLNVPEVEKMGMPPAMARRFLPIYRREVARLKVWAKYRDRLGAIVGRLQAAPTRRQLARLVSDYAGVLRRGLRRMLAAKPDGIWLKYDMLVQVYRERRIFLRAGAPRPWLKKVGQIVRTWQVKEGTHSGTSAVERRAVRRWVKEASE